MIILKLENIFEWSENKRKIRFEAFVRGPEGIKLTVIELFTGSPAQKSKKKITPGGTRTHNRLIRSQTPYPLGHGRLVGDVIYNNNINNINKLPD